MLLLSLSPLLSLSLLLLHPPVFSMPSGPIRVLVCDMFIILPHFFVVLVSSLILV
jgi:hypothetical protein